MKATTRGRTPGVRGSHKADQAGSTPAPAPTTTTSGTATAGGKRVLVWGADADRDVLAAFQTHMQAKQQK